MWVASVQIGVSTVASLPVPASYRREELADRRQPQSDQAATAQRPSQQQATGEITRIRTRASAAAQSLADQAQKFADNLPPRVRQAVAAYSSNGPSIEERLGVELAGVDVYA